MKASIVGLVYEEGTGRKTRVKLQVTGDHLDSYRQIMGCSMDFILKEMEIFVRLKNKIRFMSG